LVGQVATDPAIAITASMVFENDFDLGAERLVGALGGSRVGGVIVAAARDAEDGADAAQAMGGGMVDGPD
jgi:hypothetical protein